MIVHNTWAVEYNSNDMYQNLLCMVPDPHKEYILLYVIVIPRYEYDIVVITRVRVLITMISYEYTWYNWLVPCQRNLFCKTRLIYSIRAVGRSIQLTVLLEYIDLCY